MVGTRTVRAARSRAPSGEAQVARPMTLWAAVALTTLLAACSGAPNCKACPGDFVNLVDGQGQTLAVNAAARICIEGHPCEDRPAGDLNGSLGIGGSPDSSEDDGRTVTVTITPTDGSPARTGEGTLAYQAGRGGPCSCSGTYAEVVISDPPAG